VSGHAWFTLLVIMATVALLAGERLSPPFVVVGAVTALLVTGVIGPEQALAGFSNPAPATIAALYVLAGAADATGALERLTGRLFGRRPPPAGKGRAGRAELARMLPPIGLVSAFLYNTTLVGMLAPRVTTWARRTGRVPSAYLMAMNFAVLLGGLTTLIGTTTNVVVNGLLRSAHQPQYSMFELTRVGLPIACVGIALVVALGPRLVPLRRDSTEAGDADGRPFTVGLVVVPGGALVGQTVAAAGLRNLEGGYLVEISRQVNSVAPVAPDEVLMAGDHLTFAGNIHKIVDLARMPGLASAEERHFSAGADGGGRRLYEAVVAGGSRLAGSSLKEVGFRSEYGGAVLAIHRAGERVEGKLGEVSLRAGDVLLVLANPAFPQRWRDRGDFLVVAPVGPASAPPRRDKSTLVELITLAFVVVVTTGLIDVFQASLLAAVAVVGLGVLTPGEAREAVDLNVVILLAASFGLGAAMSASGLADELARLLIEAFQGLGRIGVLAGVLVATVVVTQLVTNNAAAILMFPIALATAGRAGLPVRPFVVAVTIAASASFLTPIGYQTNLMVYGMGNHRFGDFARLGAVLTVVLVVGCLVLIPRGWALS